MRFEPQPDGRIIITYTADEDAVLARLAAERGITNTRLIAEDIYAQFMRPSAPDLVEAIARLGPPK